MYLPYELFISLRYLKFHRKEKLLSAVSLIAILGITIGVMALLVTLSVMNGAHSIMQEKILSLSPNILILDRLRRGINNFPEIQQEGARFPAVVATSPFVYNQILLRAGGVTQGGVVKGIIPQEECKTSNLGKIMWKGNLEDLSAETLVKAGLTETTQPGIILGKELARNLGVDLNDEIALISPSGMLTPFGLLP